MLVYFYGSKVGRIRQKLKFSFRDAHGNYRAEDEEEDDPGEELADVTCEPIHDARQCLAKCKDSKDSE